jgi:hypothetical protein
MATFRTIASAAVASAVIFAGLSVLATPAHACDSNYPWTCKPVPSIDPPEAAAESDKAAAKPLKIASRRARAAAKTAKAPKAAAKAASSRAQQEPRKRFARKGESRREAARAQRARAAAARIAEASAGEVEPIEAERTPLPRPAPRRRANPTGEPNSGFAVWAERIATAEPVIEASPSERPAAATTAPPAEPMAAQPIAPTMAQAAVREAAQSTGAATAEPREPATAEPAGAPAAQPAAATAPPSVPVASQNEVNEIDLAAKDPPADSLWLRNLFIAVGGLLAVGSALRLLL